MAPQPRLPDLKDKDKLIGTQVGVPGAFWRGRMSAEERATIYMCTVREHSLMHKWVNDSMRPPSEAWELQEMGPSGTGSLELGDSSGEVFWMQHQDF